MNRNERHAAILRLVREQPLSTQTELADALRRWTLTVEPSGNLVVVTTPYGYASALAQAIDVSRHPHVAGTIAGENTVLLVAREPVTGAELAEELRALRLRG